MTIHARFLEFAEFATTGQDNKLVVVNIFDRVTAHVAAGAPWPLPDDVRIPLPQSTYLAFVLYASAADGTRHTAELRVLHEDGAPVVDPIDLGEFVFTINAQGRPLRFQGIINVGALPLPPAADYVFQLWVGGQLAGDVNLYFELTAPPA